MKISIVIPVYNASQTIESLVQKVSEALQAFNFEIILVNDGSVDNSEAICEAIAQSNSKVIFISLRKNYGEHNAVMCGLNEASGDYAVIIDDDFQNPPSEITKLVDEACKGYDVVFSRYTNKKHNFLRNLGSSFNDRMATILLDKPKGLYLSSFKAISKEIVREIIKYKGPFPYVDGLILRSTNNFSSVVTEHASRSSGRSNYTIRKLVRLYLNMFINFSIKPLRLFILMGLIIFLTGLVLGIWFVVEKLLHPGLAVGWTSIAILIILFSGFQIIFLGLISEYLGKQYLDQNGYPQWTIKKVVKKSVDA
jgi:undecaprenyl-phosphate 4-deoxy-4-formamido-L-arabinose transferase